MTSLPCSLYHHNTTVICESMTKYIILSFYLTSMNLFIKCFIRLNDLKEFQLQTFRSCQVYRAFFIRGHFENVENLKFKL